MITNHSGEKTGKEGKDSISPIKLRKKKRVNGKYVYTTPCYTFLAKCRKLQIMDMFNFKCNN